ncbi:asparagine synthase [Candidatus Berkiella cookevillensis]|uniref:asparagine synthase (glutamine-hydrolyzing) n=1 Tax=Candidatus Berkiella cookevillensis TaxID=437022 RepID=A0A0Q9YJY7_9GAMM|nr:asparagine synthetase B family protein [Candidatus Berkiella cookevillensis]MCS5709118.1 asparagine synthase [Candidatus Berkiella cookevillensis]
MNKLFGWMGNRQTENQIEVQIKNHSHHAPFRTMLLQNSAIGYDQDNIAILKNDQALIACIGSAYLKNNIYYPNDAEKNLEAILEQYLHLGPQITHQLEGQYLLLILRPQIQEVFIVQDKLGTHPIFYSKNHQGLFFGNHLRPFSKILQLKDNISTDALYHYLYYHNIPRPLCIYQKFSSILPGHYLIFQNEHLQILPYWHPTYVEHATISTAQKQSELHAHLRESVQKSITHQNAGVFLSGGIDSTSVLAMMSEQTQAPVDAFTIGFDVDNYDEVFYAKTAAKAYKANHHIYYLQAEDIIHCFDNLQDSLSQPFGNASIIPTYYCAKMAQEQNISLLLAGDGGDELFGGNARYAKQRLLSYYHLIPKFFRKNLIEILDQKLSPLKKISLISKISSYIEQANTSMPARMESYNLLNHIGNQTLLHPDMMAQINMHAPLQLLSHYYAQVDAKTMLGKMLGTDLKFTLTDSDLVKVRNACQLANINVNFPFLQAPLIDFSLQLSDKDKVSGRHLRYFYKKAIQAYIPSSIIQKQKHGFGMPYGLWLLSNQKLKDFSFERLHAFKHRSIIKASFIESLTQNLIHQHPSYYGVLCWIFLMLEGWLDKHEHPQNEYELVFKHHSASPITPTTLEKHPN